MANFRKETHKFLSKFRIEFTDKFKFLVFLLIYKFNNFNTFLKIIE